MNLTVEDVMTREVVSVDAATPFKEIAEALAGRGIGAVPVLDDDRHVIGVVSGSDLLCKEEFREQFPGEDYRPPLLSRVRHRPGSRKATAVTAADLMTSPPVTITAERSAVTAARLMNARDVRRIPVVDHNGRLVGILSRGDLVRMFLRGDEELAAVVRDDVLHRALWMDTANVRVSVRQGVVTLSGRMDRRSEAAHAVRRTCGVNGVVGVVDELCWRLDDVPA
ncbi:CBS domain-containing protein [Nonomuraea sp. NPDC049684]|uniref:CBS domain-containing protein n=1 Tax=unclassified Nonomuraea TaxID=2593643 RepID=UPI003792D145